MIYGMIYDTIYLLTAIGFVTRWQ